VLCRTKPSSCEQLNICEEHSKYLCEAGIRWGKPSSGDGTNAACCGPYPNKMMQVTVTRPFEIFESFALFKGVASSSIEFLSAQSELLELTKSQPLFFQGDPVERLYLVVEGLIKVYRLDPKGDRQVVIHMNQSGQCVAAMAVFLHQPKYPASAEAAEASRVLAISAEALYRLVQQDLTLCNNMLHLVAECAQQVVQVLDRMVFRELDSRLAEYLLFMAQTHGQGFKLPTNTEIAAIVGTTPEPVSRKLGQFSLQGWIEVKKREVRVTNPSALQKLVRAV